MIQVYLGRPHPINWPATTGVNNINSLFGVSFIFKVPSSFDTLLCFGPAVPDGYGVCYNPLENHFKFAVSASNSNPETNAARFGESLKNTFDDIQKLLTQPKL